MAKKLTKEKVEQAVNFNEEVNFNSEPSNNVKDNWNQITLSLASNGGYTINQGRKLILYVFIQEKINGKSLLSVKSFFVSKEELYDLESESREFSSEIETMLIARDKEEDAATPSKDTTKDIKKKDEVKKTGKALTEVLKKGLESAKKKDPPITYGTSEGDLDNGDPDDGMQDSASEDDYLARIEKYAEDFAKLVQQDEINHRDS